MKKTVDANSQGDNFPKVVGLNSMNFHFKVYPVGMVAKNVPSEHD